MRKAREFAIVLSLALMAMGLLLRDVRGQGYGGRPGYVAPAGSGGSAADGEYITAASCAGCSAERVATDTSSVAWDFGTAAQAKARVLGWQRPNDVLVTGIWPLVGDWWSTAAYLDSAWTTIAAEGVTSTLPALQRMSTSSANGNAGRTQTYPSGLGSAVFYPGKSMLFQTYMQSSNTNVLLWLGFGPNQSTTDPTANVVAFRLDTSVDTHYYCYTNDNSGGGTATDSGIASDANGHRFEIRETNATNYKFYIDGSVVCTNTTNLPAAAMPMGVALKNLSAAVHDVRITSLYFEQTLP